MIFRYGQLGAVLVEVPAKMRERLAKTRRLTVLFMVLLPGGVDGSTGKRLGGMRRKSGRAIDREKSVAYIEEAQRGQARIVTASVWRSGGSLRFRPVGEHDHFRKVRTASGGLPRQR